MSDKSEGIEFDFSESGDSEKHVVFMEPSFCGTKVPLDHSYVDLFTAYAETVIDVNLSPGETVVIQKSDIPPFDEWPWNQGLRELYVLTAWNPFSQKLSAVENAFRQEALRTLLDQCGAKYLTCNAHSKDGSWTEASFAIWNVEQGQVELWSQQFEQHAYFRIIPASMEVVAVPKEAQRSTQWHSEKSD